nr:probable DNA helicase MCM8 isoform X1 [Nicotiana tomentosiformis]
MDWRITLPVKEVDGTFSLPLDFLQFRKLSELQEFCVILESKPKDALLCMSASLHKQVFFEKLGDESFDDFVKINIRLHNYPESVIALKNLKAAYIDRLVYVRGTVVKVSTVKPLVMQMDFACTKCGTSITRDFPDGKFSPPPICKLHGCKCRTFNPIRSTARLIDFQKIRCGAWLL